jgi:DNA polymerase III delta prime subunit
MHHANLIIGSKEWCLACVPESVRTESIDVRHIVYERMSIDDVRSLIHDASLRPVEAPYRSFVIYTRQILGEAQNALLKLFEEPNEYVVFYFLLPNEDILLPTLRSRLILYAQEVDVLVNDVFTAFLGLSYADRLTTITEQLKVENTTWVQDFVRGLSEYAHMMKNPKIVRDVLMLEMYINAQGGSKKMLLEHMALTL